MYSENGGNGMVMPVAPYAGGYGGNDLFGGNGAWWIIILLLFGWGNNGFGGFGSSYADGYSQGYSEAMNQMNGNSGHYPMPPYYPNRRY